jgi:microsomal dipeptidase-like Zn-dependent dipeptidase
VGVKALSTDPYNLANDEIREIAASGGAIGVILMPYWLSRDGEQGEVGLDGIGVGATRAGVGRRRGGVGGERSGVDQVVDTMEHIQRITGSWDHVVIGTDFDGFTEPPEDLKDASRLGVITRALLDRGVPEDDIKKVLGENARRVLETGWV